MRQKLLICFASIVTVAGTLGAAPVTCQTAGACVPPDDCGIACCSGSCNSCCASPVISYGCS